MSEKNYKLRYSMEPWDKPIDPADKGGVQVVPGVTASRSNYGYADDIFMLSVIERDDPDGKDSLLLLSASDGGRPSKETLEKVLTFVKHVLEVHY